MNEEDEYLEELDSLEEKLIEEEQKKEEPEMPVSGKSVFEIKKIKDQKSQAKTEDE